MYELFCINSGDPYGQTQFFCEACHMNNSPVQVLPFQYDYSRIAGGDDNNCPDGIRTAFGFIKDDCSGAVGATTPICGSSSGSAHCLRDIVTFLSGKWGFIAGGINPCSGCHNPHRAQRDTHTSARFVGQKLPGVVSRPSDHSKDNNHGNYGETILMRE